VQRPDGAGTRQRLVVVTRLLDGGIAEVIDNGIYKILFGLAFGMLSEISRALRDDL